MWICPNIKDEEESENLEKKPKWDDLDDFSHTTHGLCDSLRSPSSVLFGAGALYGSGAGGLYQ